MRILIYVIVLAAWSSLAFASDNRILKIYHDSDWMNNVESSEAIWRGMNVALSEVDYTVNGARIELVKKNHSGNVTRSLRNMKDFLADADSIAVVSGMHSPPLITNRTFINENKIPVLVPWAAGGPVTRYPSPYNSVFRLSVDDTKAGDVLVSHAFTAYKCENPYLLLENTPWGDSNARHIKSALNKRGLSLAGVKRFGWSMKSHVARSLVQDVIRESADCIILASLVSEAVHIANAMADLPLDMRVPIISHWAITGGDFHKSVPHSTRVKIKLSFIQTCFSFLNRPISAKAESVFERAKSLYPHDIKSEADIKSPVGFIHAYDLTQLFIAALNNIEFTDDISANRDLLRESLEDLNEPIPGLIKTYIKPFEKFSDSNFDAHEALGRENICMARYGSFDQIFIYERPTAP